MCVDRDKNIYPKVLVDFMILVLVDFMILLLQCNVALIIMRSE